MSMTSLKLPTNGHHHVSMYRSLSAKLRTKPVTGQMYSKINLSDCVFYSYFLTLWKIEAFSLCMFLLLPNLRGVPHGTKGTGPRFVTRPAYLRSQLRNNTNTVSALVHLIHLLHVFRTRYTGIAHHRALQTSGEAGLTSKAVHGMECSGVRSLYWRSLSVGAAAGSVPYCQYKGVCSPTRPNAKQANKLSTTTDPRSCARAVYIAGDTLRHQPMGAGHMTVL